MSLQDDRFSRNIARILTTDGLHVVGCGYLAAFGRVVTCAHVVAAAAGISQYEPAPAGVKVMVDFPFRDPLVSAKASIEKWEVVETLHDDAKLPKATEDIAILELVENVDYEAARFVTAIDYDGDDFAAFGIPAGPEGADLESIEARGKWTKGSISKAKIRGWQQLDYRGETRIHPGFSGGAVWNETLNAPVGIVVANDPREGYLNADMISAASLARVDTTLVDRASPRPDVTDLDWLLHLCDRSDQVRWVEKKLDAVARAKAANRHCQSPFGWIVHGGKEQEHELFLDRVERRLFFAAFGEMEPYTEELDWPPRGRNTPEVLQSRLAEQVKFSQGLQIATWKPVVLKVYVIADEWKDSAQSVVSAFVRFCCETRFDASRNLHLILALKYACDAERKLLQRWFAPNLREYEQQTSPAEVTVIDGRLNRIYVPSEGEDKIAEFGTGVQQLLPLPDITLSEAQRWTREREVHVHRVRPRDVGTIYGDKNELPMARVSKGLEGLLLRPRGNP